MNNTKILDTLLKQQHFIDARALAVSDDMITVLNKSLEDISGQLAKLSMKYLDKDDFETISISKKQKMLQEQAQSIRDIIATVYAGKIDGLMTSSTLDAMAYSQTQTAFLLSPTINVDIETKAVTLPQVLAFQQSALIDGVTIKEWLSNMEDTSAQRIIQASRQALVQGMTVRQGASLLRKAVEGSRPQIEALARTALMSGANHAKEQAVIEIGKGLDYKWLYVATLDGRTCPICGVDDGKVFEQGDTRPNLPRHVNCRCLYVPTFDDSPKYDRPSTKHSEKTVHHRDGSQSTKFKVESSEQTTENYNQWLKRQLKEDPAFVRSILGKTRFELFSKGEITLNKMVVDNRIKSLVEL